MVELPGDLPYVFTAHAATVMAEREIDPAWVARTLQEPETVEADPSDPSLRHALRRIPERGNRVLRVVYNEESKPRRIVTVYFDRRRGSQP